MERVEVRTRVGRGPPSGRGTGMCRVNPTLTAKLRPRKRAFALARSPARVGLARDLSWKADLDESLNSARSGPSRTPRQLPGSGHCSPVPSHQCGFDSHHPLHLLSQAEQGSASTSEITKRDRRGGRIALQVIAMKVLVGAGADGRRGCTRSSRCRTALGPGKSSPAIHRIVPLPC
jgi:hypothetical protein